MALHRGSVAIAQLKCGVSPKRRTIEKMSRAFYMVGPTATGKSELAAEVAVRLGGEIVNADAFQIYQGFDVLSGKPDKSILAKVPHHLIGAVAAMEEMNAARFRELALPVIEDIRGRGKLPIVVGGTGLYVKALTEGLSKLPPADAQLRTELEKFSTEQLQSRLTELDPEAAEAVDLNNRRRVIRAIEITMISGRPLA